jgi:hypothetical protein
MTHSNAARCLTTLAATLAVALGALVLALLGPAQTLAQAHKAACGAHRKPAHGHACTHASHKRRASHRGKHHAKHAKKPVKTTSPAPAPASCEDGSEPVRGAKGAFSCDDGSEPECEDGAAPTRASGGKSLVCPAAVEAEPGAGEEECEEEPGCEALAGSISGESICASAAGEAASFVCEEGEEEE